MPRNYGHSETRGEYVALQQVPETPPADESLLRDELLEAPSLKKPKEKTTLEALKEVFNDIMDKKDARG